MVDHVVAYRLKDGVSRAEIAPVAKAIEDLRHAIPGIVSIRTGPNSGPEPYRRGYNWCFMMTFRSRPDLDNYFEHAAHLSVKPMVEAITDDLVVFDLEY